MTAVLDPEGAHISALRRLADFGDQRVLELGCGDGRLTGGIARDAADFAGKPRKLPERALASLRSLERPCAVRERCRLRRLEVRPGAGHARR
jgi:hypothetical protein